MASHLHWTLPVLLGISIVRGDSCSDALYCMHHINGVRNDLQQQDLPSICSKTMKLVMCVEASIKDCSVQSIPIPEDNMLRLSNSIVQAKELYKAYCQDVTSDPSADRETVERQPFQSVPADASCSDISECLMDMYAMTDAISNKRSNEVCHRMSPSVHCLQSAVLDCERSKQLSDEMLDNFKKSLEDSRKRLSQFCINSEATFQVRTVEPTGLANTLNGWNNIFLQILTTIVVVLLPSVV